MSTFKKRIITPAAVASAQAAAASSPLLADPRAMAVEANLGASQLPNLAASQAEANKVGASQEENVDVPIGRIRSNPVNPRSIYTSADIDDMAMSLAANGQKVRAPAYLDEEGFYVLIDGERRLRGARAAGLAHLKISRVEKPSDVRSLYEAARLFNKDRKEQNPLDDAIRWKQLIEDQVYPTQAALTKALNLREDHVSRTIQLAALPQRLIKTLSDFPDLLNLKMLNALREFCEATNEDETITLVQEAEQKGFGYREVMARRQALTRGPVRKPRSISAPVRYASGKGEIKTFEKDGRLELSVKGLSAEDMSQLTEKIKQLFPEA